MKPTSSPILYVSAITAVVASSAILSGSIAPAKQAVALKDSHNQISSRNLRPVSQKTEPIESNRLHHPHSNPKPEPTLLQRTTPLDDGDIVVSIQERPSLTQESINRFNEAFSNQPAISFDKVRFSYQSTEDKPVINTPSKPTFILEAGTGDSFVATEEDTTDKEMTIEKDDSLSVPSPLDGDTENTPADLPSEPDVNQGEESISQSVPTSSELDSVNDENESGAYDVAPAPELNTEPNPDEPISSPLDSEQLEEESVSKDESPSVEPSKFLENSPEEQPPSTGKDAKQVIDEKINAIKVAQEELDEAVKARAQAYVHLAAVLEKYNTERESYLNRVTVAQENLNSAGQALNKVRGNIETITSSLAMTRKDLENARQKELIDKAEVEKVRGVLHEAQRDLNSTREAIAEQESKIDHLKMSIPKLGEELKNGIVSFAEMTQEQFMKATEAQVVDMVNAYRVNAGLDPIAYSPKLSSESLAWSKHMGTENPHDTGFSGYKKIIDGKVVPYDNYGHAKASGQNGEGLNDSGFSVENISYIGNWSVGKDNDPTELAVKIFTMWKESPGHNKNILNPNITIMSLGISAHQKDDGGGNYYYSTWRGYRNDFRGDKSDVFIPSSTDEALECLGEKTIRQAEFTNKGGQTEKVVEYRGEKIEKTEWGTPIKGLETKSVSGFFTPLKRSGEKIVNTVNDVNKESQTLEEMKEKEEMLQTVVNDAQKSLAKKELALQESQNEIERVSAKEGELQRALDKEKASEKNALEKLGEAQVEYSESVASEPSPDEVSEAQEKVDKAESDVINKKEALDKAEVVEVPSDGLE